MIRYGKQNSGYGLIDSLTLTYNGNQLKKVTDTASDPLYQGAFHFQDGGNVAVEYLYDTNGNMTVDYNKKISKIQYNQLNLPNKLQFTYGHTTSYRYGADGTKRNVTHVTSTTNLLVPMGSIVAVPANQIASTMQTDYCGNLIYENGVLSKILTEEGYITLNGTTPVYHYYLKDHQGNNRVVIDQSGVVEQVNHYYPFGMTYGDGIATSNQPYKYNGKELDRMHGLDWYDYGARLYDSELGRFHTVDPLAERRPWMSPYVFCSDNPVNRIDMDGNWDVSVHLAQNRSQNGYGVAIVTDRNGNEVYRFQVRAEGTGGRNRMNKNADTPLGTYDIPDKNTWGTGGSRASYGPNARLNMTPESGEIEESGRDAIRIHGGRQEVYDSKTGKWTPSDSPELKKTNGCLRAFDTDMSAFKKITDNLQKTDSKEIPGQVTITDDLDKLVSPTKTETVEGVKLQYFVPEAQLNYWQNVVKKVFDNKNNGGQ